MLHLQRSSCLLKFHTQLLHLLPSTLRLLLSCSQLCRRLRLRAAQQLSSIGSLVLQSVPQRLCSLAQLRCLLAVVLLGSCQLALRLFTALLSCCQCSALALQLCLLGLQAGPEGGMGSSDLEQVEVEIEGKRKQQLKAGCFLAPQSNPGLPAEAKAALLTAPNDKQKCHIALHRRENTPFNAYYKHGTLAAPTASWAACSRSCACADCTSTSRREASCSATSARSCSSRNCKACSACRCKHSIPCGRACAVYGLQHWQAARAEDEQNSSRQPAAEHRVPPALTMRVEEQP